VIVAAEKARREQSTPQWSTECCGRVPIQFQTSVDRELFGRLSGYTAKRCPGAEQRQRNAHLAARAIHARMAGQFRPGQEKQMAMRETWRSRSGDRPGRSRARDSPSDLRMQHNDFDARGAPRRHHSQGSEEPGRLQTTSLFYREMESRARHFPLLKQALSPVSQGNENHFLQPWQRVLGDRITMRAIEWLLKAVDSDAELLGPYWRARHGVLQQGRQAERITVRCRVSKASHRARLQGIEAMPATGSPQPYVKYYKRSPSAESGRRQACLTCIMDRFPGPACLPRTDGIANPFPNRHRSLRILHRGSRRTRKSNPQVRGRHAAATRRE